MINRSEDMYSQKGFSHPVLIVVVLLVVAIVGFALYRVSQNEKSDSSISQTSNSQGSNEITGISSKSDLDKAVQQLKSNSSKNDTSPDEEKLRQIVN